MVFWDWGWGLGIGIRNLGRGNQTWDWGASRAMGRERALLADMGSGLLREWNSIWNGPWNGRTLVWTLGAGGVTTAWRHGDTGAAASHSGGGSSGMGLFGAAADLLLGNATGMG